MKGCELVAEWYEEICLDCCRKNIKRDPKTCVLADLIKEIEEEGE